MELREAYRKARTAVIEAFPALDEVESGFDKTKHGSVFRENENGNLEAYLKAAKFDFRNPKILPRDPDRIIEISGQPGTIADLRQDRPETKKLIEDTIRTKGAALIAAHDVLEQLHGKTLAEAVEKYRELDEQEDAEAKKEFLTNREWIDGLRRSYFQTLAAYAFNHTVLNHWEEVHGVTIPDEHRHKINWSFGPGIPEEQRLRKSRGYEMPKAFIAHIHETLKRIQEGAEREKQTERLRENAPLKVGSVLDSFILGADRGRIEKWAIKKMSTRSDLDATLEEISARALSTHNRQLSKLAAQPKYAGLQIKERLELLEKILPAESETKIEHVIFGLVHSMVEGRPTEEIDSQLPSLREKTRKVEKEVPVSTAVATQVQPKRDFSDFLARFELAKSEIKALGNKLNAIQTRVGRFYLDTHFLVGLKLRLHDDANASEIAAAIDDERRKHYEKQAGPTPEEQPHAPEVVTAVEEKKPRGLSEIVDEIDDIIARERGVVTNQHIADLKTAAKNERKTAGNDLLKRATEHVLLSILSSGDTKRSLHDYSVKRHLPEFFADFGEDAWESLKQQEKLVKVDQRVWTIAPKCRGKYRVARK